MKQKNNPVRVVLLAMFCLCMSVAVKAQDGDETGFSFGVKAGFGTTNLTLDKMTTLGENRTTFMIGGTVQYQLNTWFGAAVGLEYTQNGGAGLSSRMFYHKASPMHEMELYEDGQVRKNVRTDLRIHSLELPVTARFSVPMSSGFKPFLMLGPSFSYNLASKVTNYNVYDYGEEGVLNDLMTSSSDKVNDKIEKMNISALFGVGTEISAYGLTFEVGCTYRLGLVNQNDYLYSVYQQYSSNTFMGYIAVKF